MILVKKASFLTLLLLASAVVRAGNVVAFSSVEGIPGTTVSIDVALDNAEAVSALQLNIPIGDNVEYVAGSAELNSERSANHSITAAATDGILKVAIYSVAMNAVRGNAGRLFSFDLLLKGQPGDFALTANEIIATDTSGGMLEVACSGGTVRIVAPRSEYSSYDIDFGSVPLRDTYSRKMAVYNSGNADLVISDVIYSDAALTTANTLPMTIGPGSTGYIEVRYAPVKRGAVKATMRVVSNTTTARNTIEINAAPYAVNELHVLNASGTADSEVEIALRVNNMDALCGFQIDFRLPSQLRYVDGSFALSDRSNGHHAVANLTDGVLHLMAYSARNTAFGGEDGVIATFKVQLSGRYGCSVAAERCILTSILDEMPTDVTSAIYSGTVNILSPQISGNGNASLGRQPVTGLSSVTYCVRNYGSAPLTIDRVFFDNDAFAITDELPLTIEQGSSHDLTLLFTTNEVGAYEGNMSIYSNDPDLRLKKVAVSGTIYSPNFVTLADTKCTAADLVLSNNEAISGMQFDFTYPSEKFSLSSDDFVAKGAMEGFMVTARRTAADCFKVFVYSLSGSMVAADTAAVMRISLTPLVTTVPGRFDVSVSNVILSNDGLSAINSSSSATGKISYYASGDANGDWKVDVGDFSTIAGRILGGNTENFIEFVADTNGDGNIDVADLARLVGILLKE